MEWVNRADAQWGCGDCGAALASYRRALRVSTAACYTLARGLALLGQGIVLWSVGRLPEAARSLGAGLETVRDIGNAWWIAYGLTYLGNVRASLGDLDGARRLSREAVARAQESGVGYPLALSRLHALWQDEVAAPGQAEHAPRIEEALRETQRLGLRAWRRSCVGYACCTAWQIQRCPKRRSPASWRTQCSSTANGHRSRGAWSCSGGRCSTSAPNAGRTSTALPSPRWWMR